MPKNFDELTDVNKYDYDFVVRGETFTFMELSPRAMAAVDGILESTNGNDENALQIWDRFSNQIEAFLPPEQRERWRELYTREEEPITVRHLIAIRNWLVEVQTGDRPTKAPSPSSSGRGKTAVSSKDA